MKAVVWTISLLLVADLIFVAYIAIVPMDYEVGLPLFFVGASVCAVLVFALIVVFPSYLDSRSDRKARRADKL